LTFQLDGRCTVQPEVKISMMKRQVEVFTAGCPVCEPAVQLVKELAGTDCEVTIHDLREDLAAAERAGRYGVNRVPAVVVDGSIVSCCDVKAPSRDELSAAGIGQRLS
jgi:glutaredoxin